LSARFFVVFAWLQLFFALLSRLASLAHSGRTTRTKKKFNLFFFFFFFANRSSFALLALIAAANAAQLDSTLASFLDRAEANTEKAERLYAAFSTKVPWLSTNGGILDYFHQNADKLTAEARTEFSKLHGTMERDAKPEVRVTGRAADVHNKQVAVRCQAANGDGESAIAGMADMGFKSAMASGDIVSGLIASDRVKDLADSAAFTKCRFDHFGMKAGSALSQGDKAAGTNVARSLFGLTGKGIKVGVISDSFACDSGARERDIASGDLPADTTIVQEYFPCLNNNPDDDDGTDEGRAMAQIIHDMAPDAAIAFCSAANGYLYFEKCIDDLAVDCDIIVDDIIFLGDSAFQDGLIAQAANRAAANGVAYFSAAGNNARDSWEGPFLRSQFTIDLGGVEQLIENDQYVWTESPIENIFETPHDVDTRSDSGDASSQRRL
jgi:hypothetical protein